MILNFQSNLSLKTALEIKQILYIFDFDDIELIQEGEFITKINCHKVPKERHILSVIEFLICSFKDSPFFITKPSLMNRIEIVFHNAITDYICSQIVNILEQNSFKNPTLMCTQKGVCSIIYDETPAKEDIDNAIYEIIKQLPDAPFVILTL